MTSVVLCSIRTFSFSGLQRVHHPRDELTEGTVQDQAHHTQGDRQDGEHHQQEVQLDPGSAETINLRGRDDPQISLPGCQEEEAELQQERE